MKSICDFFPYKFYARISTHKDCLVLNYNIFYNKDITTARNLFIQLDLSTLKLKHWRLNIFVGR